MPRSPADHVDPKAVRSEAPTCRLAGTLLDLQPLHRLCRDGKLFEVADWIGEGRPLQLAPEAAPKGRRPLTTLEIALQSGQHSLTLLLLRSGYRFDLEPESPLNLAMRLRRWDLVDLLWEWGADPKAACLSTLFETYNMSLFERFRVAGVALTEGHALAEALGYHTSNKPLFGFARRYRNEEPGYQRELDIALGLHAQEGNEKGILLCLWAGADPHARVPDLGYPGGEETDGQDPDDYETAVEQAARKGNLGALKRFRPDPTRVDFDALYRSTSSGAVVEFLAGIQPPKDLTGVIQAQCWGLDSPWFPERRSAEALIETLSCAVRWEVAEPSQLAGIRRDLLKAADYSLREILSLLQQPDVCALEIFQELTRTPSMQRRMLAMHLVRPKPKPISKAERLRRDATRLAYVYDREKLYEQVWSRPVLHVAKDYGVSGVYLARVCRALCVPVPKRGYWARVQRGYKVKRPALPHLDDSGRTVAAAPPDLSRERPSRSSVP